MTGLYRVLYCSRNQLDCRPEELVDVVAGILQRSRANNSRDGITGGLLFSEGYFAQVLEGDLEAVEAAFERIQCDHRHSDVIVLQAGSITHRDFPDWSMAFAAPDTATPQAGVTLRQASAGKTDAAGSVLDMLRGVVMREAGPLQ